MSRFIDLTGQRFGQITVVERTQNHICTSGQQKTAWRCLCDCGKEFVATSQNLRRGHYTSSEQNKNRNKWHLRRE